MAQKQLDKSLLRSNTTYNQFFLLYRESGDAISMKLFEEIIDE